MPASGRQLVIEYVLEGHQRGYNFTSSTQGYSEDELKAIWRSAMPRGQGWTQYVGARSLKCFPLDGRVVMSETIVTDQRDESGRGGIRRTVIDVLNPHEYRAALEQRLRDLPSDVQSRVDRIPTFTQRLAMNNQLMTHKKDQLVILHTYSTPERWQVMEGLLIKLALSPVTAMVRWGRIIPFTTLALSANDESALVALPADKAERIDRKTPSIKI
jgi:hypothetical protein